MTLRFFSFANYARLEYLTSVVWSTGETLHVRRHRQHPVELTTNTVSSTNNYAVPSATTTINLTSSINHTPFLAPSSATGPNGESASINYDTLARPQSSVSPYGTTTTYAYNDTAPATRTATTNGH